MRFCIACLKPIPKYRGERVQTCSVQCVNAWAWMSRNTRAKNKELVIMKEDSA